MTLVEWVNLVVQIVTAAAIIFAVMQLVGARTQQHREFENLYVQRYWKLLDEMSQSLYEGNPDDPSTPADRRVVLAYLRLCEDELDLRSQGFVTDRTWNIWAEGIRAQVGSAPYSSMLAGLDSSELPSLRRFADDFVDPLTWPRHRRWWSGLR